jgi:hypothetical protein
VLVSRELKAAAGGTVRANNGVQLRVPAHVMLRNGIARITNVSHGVYDLQILAPWSGPVIVTIPLEGHGDEVMHEIGGYWVPESDKVGQGTVRVYHLSPFSALSSLASKAVGAASNFLCIKLTVHLFLECLLKKGLSQINSDLAHWLLGKLSSSCAGALFVDGVGGALVDIALGAINEPACTGTAGGPGYTYPPSVQPSSRTSTPAASGSTPSSGWVRISWSQAHLSWIVMTLGQFASGTYRYTCNFGSGGSRTYTLVVTGDPQTFDNGQTCFDNAAGETLWVTIGSQSSNTLTGKHSRLR